MSSTAADPRVDLTIERIIRASPASVWRAWTEPEFLEKWWIPAPARARIEKLEVTPGGGFVTSMSEGGGGFTPHTDGIFLVVEPGRRLVFTNVIDSSWHPAAPEPVAMTAEITLDPHADGTAYRAIVRHGDPEARDLHESLGFFDGWGAVTEALAELVERADPSD